MRTCFAFLTFVLAAVGGVGGAPAQPSAADVSRAGALAAQVQTPAVRAALQCRVAFADTTASVPVKDRADKGGSSAFWADYLRRLRAVDVAGCPEDFRAAFERHVHAVKTVADSLNHPYTRPAAAMTGAYRASDARRTAPPDAPTFGTETRGHYEGLDDCGKTYQAVFAAANRSMKTAPAADGRLAGQIDGLLKE